MRMVLLNFSYLRFTFADLVGGAEKPKSHVCLHRFG
jgi:hypothetical protein